MNKTQFLNLLDKYIRGETTLQEDEMLNNYYNSFQNNFSMDNGGEIMREEELGDKILTRINNRIDSEGAITFLF